MAKKEKVVLAYSGGLDTSVILPWLKETYGYETIAFAADLGQGDELSGIKQKALKSGAVKCIVKDLRKEFVEEYLWRLLKSGAVYENGYLLGTSIARPLIAKHQVDVAHAEGATGVAHGATGKGNDQVRLNLHMALDPTLKIIARWKTLILPTSRGRPFTMPMTAYLSTSQKRKYIPATAMWISATKVRILKTRRMSRKMSCG
jgi:argininosuccinate synthase